MPPAVPAGLVSGPSVKRPSPLGMVVYCGGAGVAPPVPIKALPLSERLSPKTTNLLNKDACAALASSAAANRRRPMDPPGRGLRLRHRRALPQDTFGQNWVEIYFSRSTCGAG